MDGAAIQDSMPYLPFDGGRFRLSMGLMVLAEAEWLEIGGDVAATLARKRRLLATRPGEVFAALPEAAAPAAELLALLAAHLPQHHPTIYRREGERLVNHATAERWDLDRPGLHPLDLAGRLVPEDFCLLLTEEGESRLVGGSVCSPARWRLAEKLGRPLDTIHAPVPGYAETLDRPVARLLAQLKPGKLVWRLNWGLSDDPEPFQPVAATTRPIAVEMAGERLWFRVERQTLRRLPVSGAVVFTIRTYIARLDAAIATPATAAEFAGAIRAMSPPMQAYKGIAPVAEPLLAWLDAHA